jgi:acyl-CoA thioester hydrolase
VSRVFPCRVKIAVQWGDVDMMKHVNNVVFFRWFETARTRYFEEIGFDKRAPSGVYPILASIRADYRGQLRYPDTISVECSVSKIGKSSCTQVYQVVSEAQGKVVAEGEGTWVCFDYPAQKSRPLPLELVEAIETYEGRSYS